MTQHIKNITSRLSEIERERQLLDAEASMLTRIRYKINGWPDLLRDSDEFSHRTATKFELLIRIAEHLSSEDPLLYGGASTREIFEAVATSINKESERIVHFNNSQARIDKGKEKDPGTPMTNSEKRINYNTFRSYLARFKGEGRIYFDEKRRRWRITPEPWESSKQDEKDDDEDYS